MIKTCPNLNQIAAMCLMKPSLEVGRTCKPFKQVSCSDDYIWHLPALSPPAISVLHVDVARWLRGLLSDIGRFEKQSTKIPFVSRTFYGDKSLAQGSWESTFSIQLHNSTSPQHLGPSNPPWTCLFRAPLISYACNVSPQRWLRALGNCCSSFATSLSSALESGLESSRDSRVQFATRLMQNQSRSNSSGSPTSAAGCEFTCANSDRTLLFSRIVVSTWYEINLEMGPSGSMRP